MVFCQVASGPDIYSYSRGYIYVNFNQGICSQIYKTSNVPRPAKDKRVSMYIYLRRYNSAISDSIVPIIVRFKQNLWHANFYFAVLIGYGNNYNLKVFSYIYPYKP